jgi:DNA-binding XRE family transcriptional regulator
MGEEPGQELTLVERVRLGRLPPVAVRERIRIEAGLSLRALAAELGVDPMSVYRWERGYARPRLEHAIAYAKLLDQLEQACR